MLPIIMAVLASVPECRFVNDPVECQKALQAVEPLFSGSYKVENLMYKGVLAPIKCHIYPSGQFSFAAPVGTQGDWMRYFGKRTERGKSKDNEYIGHLVGNAIYKTNLLGKECFFALIKTPSNSLKTHHIETTLYPKPIDSSSESSFSENESSGDESSISAELITTKIKITEGRGQNERIKESVDKIAANIPHKLSIIAPTPKAAYQFIKELISKEDLQKSLKNMTLIVACENNHSMHHLGEYNKHFHSLSQKYS